MGLAQRFVSPGYRVVYVVPGGNDSSKYLVDEQKAARECGSDQEGVSATDDGVDMMVIHDCSCAGQDVRLQTQTGITTTEHGSGERKSPGLGRD